GLLYRVEYFAKAAVLPRICCGPIEAKTVEAEWRFVRWGIVLPSAQYLRAGGPIPGRNSSL
ncbi:unnamed protein product, partial [marine sediment metagenome]